MKYKTLMILLIGAHLAVAQPERKLQSEISHVTVFLHQAQITRTGNLRLDAGKSTVVLSGLAANLDPQSIQVSGKGNFTILGVSYRQNYLNEVNMPSRLRLLHDSLEYFQNKLTLEQNRKDILNKEEQMIISNQRVGGTQQNVTVAELKSMADFFRSRLAEIGQGRLAADQNISTFNKTIGKLNRQIAEETDVYKRNTGEIVIPVSADATVAASFEVNYVVANAGWNPVYDIRAIDTEHPVGLAYRANVYQSTGEVWKNVSLTLSSANPSLGGVKPELYPWYLDIAQVRPYDKQNYGLMRSAPSAAPMLKGEAVVSDAATTADYVNTVQTTLNVRFDINLPYTVTSGGKPALVDIRNLDVDAKYRYAVAPRLDADAFLIAETTGWEDLSLLPGEANVFFEGSLVGKTYINPESTKDTLAISMGRDQRIVVKREKVKDFTSRRLIGGNLRDTYSWETSVRNTRQQGITIKIEDQVPVSRNSQIEVSVGDIGGAKHDSVTGKLTWELSIRPGETKKVQFMYEVKYPKDQPIQGL